MTIQSPPFRADHVGSLLRPKRLLEARTARQSGRFAGAATIRSRKSLVTAREVWG